MDEKQLLQRLHSVKRFFLLEQVCPSSSTRSTLYPRLPLPSAVTSALVVSRAMSWGTLVAEAVIPVAVWFPRTRRPALIAAIAFHLTLEALMNLFFFQWIMIAAWLAHLRWDEDVAWIRARLGRP